VPNSNDLGEIAIRGERGIDVFQRVENASERRHHYECIATVLHDGNDAQVLSHHRLARKNSDRMLAAAKRLHESDWLGQAITLDDLRSYPPARLDVFQYLDFMRCWLVADMEITRMGAALERGAEIQLREISSVLRLLLNYNQITRAAFFTDAFLPYLGQVAREQRDDRWQNAAYSLRMIGDLYARADRFADALTSYEAAIHLGDNRHRRGLAIEAARAAGKNDALLFHLQAYEAKWPLPPALEEIRQEAVGAETGETE